MMPAVPFSFEDSMSSDCCMREEDESEEDVSLLLQKAQQGNAAARDSLFGLLHQHMRGLANSLMRQERTDHTLQASGLVNEACLKLLQQNIVLSAANRRQLFAAAIRSMQQVLIDYARSRATDKRGGVMKRHGLDVVLDSFEASHQIPFIDLERVLERLRQTSPRQHEILSLRFFAGLTIPETAKVLECSVGTVESDWRLARARLHVWLKDET